MEIKVRNRSYAQTTIHCYQPTITAVSNKQCIGLGRVKTAIKPFAFSKPTLHDENLSIPCVDVLYCLGNRCLTPERGLGTPATE